MLSEGVEPSFIYYTDHLHHVDEHQNVVDEAREASPTLWEILAAEAEEKEEEEKPEPKAKGKDKKAKKAKKKTSTTTKRKRGSSR